MLFASPPRVRFTKVAKFIKGSHMSADMVITSIWAFESNLLNLPGLTETTILRQAFPRLSALKCLAICKSSEVDSEHPWTMDLQSPAERVGQIGQAVPWPRLKSDKLEVTLTRHFGCPHMSTLHKLPGISAKVNRHPDLTVVARTAATQAVLQDHLVPSCPWKQLWLRCTSSRNAPYSAFCLPVDIDQALPAAVLLPRGNRVRAFQSPLEAVQAPEAGTRSSQFFHGQKNLRRGNESQHPRDFSPTDF